jgi:hypothetical protein
MIRGECSNPMANPSGSIGRQFYNHPRKFSSSECSLFILRVPFQHTINFNVTTPFSTYLLSCCLCNTDFPLLLVSLFVEFSEEEEEQDRMHANEPHKGTGIVAVNKQQLE